MWSSSSTQRRRGRRGDAEKLRFQISNLKFEISNAQASALPPRPLRLCVESYLPYTQAATMTHAAPLLTKTFFTILLLFLISFAANAQDSAAASKAGDELIVEGSYTSDVFGLGRDVRVRGD